MGGISFRGVAGGGTGVPFIIPMLLAGGGAGGVTINAGDAVVRTTKANLTANAVPVGRTLLQADVTLLYQQTAVNAGILGIACDDVTTNAAGQAIATPPLGGILTGAAVVYPYSYDGLLGIDPNSLRGQARVIAATQNMIFGCKLDPASAVGTQALVGTLAGLKLTGTVPTVFTIDTTGGSTNILRIVAVNYSDPLYGLAGCEVQFQILPAYCQYENSVLYSTN